jgi:integrase
MAGKSKEWPHIYPKVNKLGDISWWVDLRAVNAKPKRPTFPTKAAAEARAQAARTEREREGKEAANFPYADRVMALHCINRLKPHGVTLDAAVDDYMKHILPSRTSKTVSQIIQGLVDSADLKGQQGWKKELEDFGRKFCPQFGNMKLAELQKDDLQKWLNQRGAEYCLGPRSLKNLKDRISYLFNQGRGEKELLENLGPRLVVPENQSEELPGIYTIEETQALLLHAPDYDLLPYVAISAFAGLRRCEVKRLDWTRVRPKYLAVTAKTTKRTKKNCRARRLVPISPTLAAWLAPFRSRTGPVIGKGNLNERMIRLRKAAGISHPTPNFFRHGFATYHLAAYENDTETARILGHVSTDMLHNTYKGREVEKEDGLKYFALTPQAVFPGGVPTGTGKYKPVLRSQPWITPIGSAGPNPFKSGSLRSVLFARGSKGFIQPSELVRLVAVELNHPPTAVKAALDSARNPRHHSNQGKCFSERNEVGEIRLLAGINSSKAGKTVITVAEPVREEESVTPLVATEVAS